MIKAHLASRQVSRVIYGAIVGLALIVALEDQPPKPELMVATLLGTAVAVGLAELYSDFVGTESRTRRRVRGAEAREMAYHAAAVASGIAFPVVFFILAAAQAIDKDTAFTISKWSGLALIALYGFSAARMAGESLPASALQALAVSFIGGLLIALKALLH